MSIDCWVNRQRFKTMADVLVEKVAKLDGWIGMDKPEDEECLIYYWTVSNNGHIKFVSGNCYMEYAKTVHLPTTTIQLYDAYSDTYGYCVSYMGHLFCKKFAKNNIITLFADIASMPMDVSVPNIVYSV